MAAGCPGKGAPPPPTLHWGEDKGGGKGKRKRGGHHKIALPLTRFRTWGLAEVAAPTHSFILYLSDSLAAHDLALLPLPNCLGLALLGLAWLGFAHSTCLAAPTPGPCHVIMARKDWLSERLCSVSQPICLSCCPCIIVLCLFPSPTSTRGALL